MLRLIENKIILKLWTARIVSVFGDIFFDIFVTWAMYARFKDLKVIVYALGGSFVLKSMFAVFSGKITDSFSRRKIVMLTDIGSALIVSLFVLFNKLGSGYLAFFIFLFIVKTFLGSLFGNAYSAFFADNVKPGDFIKAQALISGSIRTINFFGAAAAGIMVAFLPLHWAVVLDAASFLFSAAVFYSLKNDIPAEETHKQRPAVDFSKYLDVAVLRQSWGFVESNILSNRFVLVFCGNVFLLNLVYGYIPNVFPYLLAQNSGYGAAYLGILRSTIAIGEVLGLAIVGKYGHRVSKCFIYGLFGTAVSLIMILVPIAPVATIIAAYFLYGLSDSVTQPYYSYFVTSLPSQVRGRMLGAVDMVVLIAAPIGMFFGEKIFSHSVHIGIIAFTAIIGIVLAGFIAGKQTRGIVADVQ